MSNNVVNVFVCTIFSALELVGDLLPHFGRWTTQLKWGSNGALTELAYQKCFVGWS